MTILRLLLWMGWLFSAAAFAIDPYEVSDIRLDVRGNSDSQAKAEALRLAERKAFDLVIKRLVPVAEMQKARGPLRAADLGSQLPLLVGDLQIADERFGQGRYLATATVRFKPQAMRRFLNNRGVKYAENFSAPLLILPLLRRGNDVVLWGGDNLLLQAVIRSQNLSQGLLPYVVPYGDIEDVTLLTASAAQDFLNSGNRATNRTFVFADIVERYRVGGVIVMLGDITGNTISLSARMLIRGKIYDFAPQNYTLDGGLQEAVTLGLGRLEERWKADNLVNDGDEKTIYAIVNGASLAELRRQLQQLRQVAVIDKAHAVRVSARQVVIEIGFRSSLQQLQSVLLNHGMRLDRRRSTGQWYLRRL